MAPPKNINSIEHTASNRMDYLDAARGITIILVVIVHHLLGVELVQKLLMSFIITSFLMISGFLFAYKKEWKQSFRSVVVKNLKRLMYPYFTFGALMLLWNVLYYKVVFPAEVPEYSITEMFLYTVSTYGYNALWYLPFAFWGSLGFLAIRKTNRHHLICVTSAIFLLVFYILFDKMLSGRGLVSYIYSYLFRCSIGVVFIYAGYVLYSVLQKCNKKQESLLLISCMIISIIIGILYHLYPEQFPIVNLATHRLGNPYVYYLAAISFSVAIILLCKKLSGPRGPMGYFGRNSIIVMALHMDVTGRIAWWIMAKLPIDFGEVINSMLVIAMEIAMFPLMIYILNRYFPFITKYPQRNCKTGR